MEKKYYKLTAPQKSIWLTEQYYKNTNINNVCGTFYSDECLDFEILKKAINIFLQNNDSFKIKLHFTEDKINQYFSNLDYIDFQIIDINNKKEQIALEEKLASRVFNMLDSLLFEIVLFRYPDNHGGFIINSHHIISDSWTNGIVANDVALIYAKIKKHESYQKDEVLSYKNYISSEKDYISSDKFQKDKKYWNDLFHTIPEVATIPSIKDNKKDEDLSAKRLLLDINKKMFKTINAYCDKNKVSFYNFFMAIYSLYLGRVSNLDEFVIGTPILNRTNFKEKQTTGMFINTLPLKVTLLHEKTFLENLKDIAVNSMSLLRHQKYSYQYLIEDLRKRDSNLPKLYNVMFSYQITKMNENMASLEHTTSWTFNKTIADDLDIHMFEWNENNSIQIAYDYRTNKYDEQDILDLHARILHIINQVLQKEDILLKDIEIVTPEEKHKILYEFNNTKVDYPKNKTIVDLFEEQVEKTPDNIAVVFENQKLTYRELNEKANQLAHCLLYNNTNIGDIICILLDKSLEMIVSILGILKVGATFLPIDINYPKERIDYIIENSNSHILLTSQNLFNNTNNTIQVFNVELINALFSQYPKGNLHINYGVNTSAYVMYTSGSTGNPKGVMVTHRNIVRLVKNSNFVNLNKDEHILQTGSIVFDACTFEIWTALLNGYKLFIMKKEDLLDAHQLEKYLSQNKISTLWLTAPLFNQLCESNPYMFKNVKNLLTGGDILSPKHINMLKKACPHLTVINGYGPTENTTFSCCFTINKSYESSIPIGKPVSNSTAYVVSKMGSLCPIGVPGELWVGGDGVSKGYLNNEALTKNQFINNPFDEGRIYKTGDLVRWLSDGNIEFIGRIDNQVKIRGFRVELNEINNTILTHPDIKQAFSLVYTINNTKYICSYFVSPNNINISNLKEYLKKTLPNFMIPHFLIQINNLPLNVNGKVDKKSLPEPTISASQRDVVLPSNELECEIFQILKSTISNDNISVLDDFFDDLEVDSLTAMKISALLSKYNITIQDISTYSSIRSLANHISEKKIKSFEKAINLPTTPIKNISFSFDLTNVLLTGGIGFLGIHILYELINNPSVSKIYCLIRSKDNKSPYERLENILDFYFSEDIKQKILDSVIIIEGDFCYKNLNLDNYLYQKLVNTITTVIHCGANVKHYGKFEHFYKSNVEGTKNILYFCENSNAKLAHISTTSVGGFSDVNDLKILDEDSININQHFNNHVYMITKYLAEIEVLNAINSGIVYAKIFRIGNMMPRLSDNKFQINLYDNAFISRLDTLSKLHVIIPEYKKVVFDITPVDLCCNALIKILGSQHANQTIYHIYNPNTFTIEDILSKLNLDIQEISISEFTDKIVKANNPLYTHLLNDIKLVNNVESKVINIKTVKSLESLDFHWPSLPDSYIKNLINLY